MAYKLYAIRLFSYRWAESLAFYRDKIKLPVFFENEDIGWAQFDIGGVYLGLERCDPDDPESKNLVGRFVGTSIQVEDIEATYKTLNDNGVRLTGPPELQPWGGVLAHFVDPDENIVTLMGEPSANP